MSHDHHPSLPGYHPDQILVDGCAECEQRALNVEDVIAKLDVDRFVAAWKRASEWQRSGGLAISQAEVPLLRVLWAIIVQLERRGITTDEIPGNND